MRKITFNGTPFYKLFANLPRMNEVANKENIEIFKKYGISNSGDLRHTCVLCGKKVNLECSVSNEGHKLICVQCVHKYFEGDYNAVFEWNQEE